MEWRGDMDKHLLKTFAAVAAALVMVACSDSPKPAETPAADAKKEAPKVVEPVTGQTAFYEIYKLARSWAPTDLTALSLKSGELEGFKNADGKAGLWTAVFVSPSIRQARTFTYAIADAGAIQKGVSASASEPWSGENKDSLTFQNENFQVDSDAAFKTAAAKAADWLKDHADKKCTMTLGNASRFSAPVWWVMWGDAKSGYTAYVNAASGELVTK
jgi:hypothetical protein